MTDSKATFPNRIQVTKLGEYVSKSSGRPYLVGYMAGVKVIAIPDPSAEPMKGAMQNWNLYFEPAPPRKGGTP
jgi:hypothetical protein